MVCKIDACNRPIYHHNPLIDPLLNFHGKIINLLCELPKEGIALEVAIRIGYVVVSPFAYLALSFTALAGLILSRIWKRRHPTLSNQTGKSLTQIDEEIKKPETVSMKTEKTVQLPQVIFGKSEWEKTFPITIQEEPLLPSNIEEILETEDPFEPGKKLKETCILFWRPNEVILHGESGDSELLLNFNGVEELAKNAINPDQRTKYITFDKLRENMNKIPVKKAGWVLMRREVIPGSRELDFQTQKKLLKGSYVTPNLMDAILLNILTYANFGKFPYGRDYTRCLETFLGFQLVVRGFPQGLDICHDDFDDNDIGGLSAVWRLG